MTPEHRGEPDGWVLADAFDRAAPSYDAMVALSPGYHDQLDGAATALMGALGPGQGPAPAPTRLLDLGCGSGASTRALVRAWARGRLGPATLEVTGVDASPGMLGQARGKQWPAGVRFVEQDAVGYLRQQPDASVDGVLAAYLLRNVPDREALMKELARVLAPGAPLVVHDYSVAGSRVAQGIWAVVCHAVIIPLARLKRSDVPLHRYLYVSVRDFDSVQQICERMQMVGLVDVRHRTYAGWQSGMVHTVLGVAPGAVDRR